MMQSSKTVTKLAKKIDASALPQILIGLGVAQTTAQSLLAKSSLKRKIKDSAKALFFQFYRLAQRLGWNIYPSHYYTASPNVVELARQRNLWAKPSEMVGTDRSSAQQLITLKSFVPAFREEYGANLAYRAGVSGNFGPGFGYVEAQCLYAMVRHFRPRRIIEVGSGVSSLVSLVASQINFQESKQDYSLTCIEPYPSSALLNLIGKDPKVAVITDFVQKVPLSVFTSLKKNDILFIDSSHVAKAGSDVIHLILEVIPRLAAGTVVHVHDIYFPYSYQRDLLGTFIHNNETAFMQALLTNNSKLEILFALSQLHYSFPEELKSIFPGYEPQASENGLRTGDTKGMFPSSLWLRVR